MNINTRGQIAPRTPTVFASLGTVVRKQQQQNQRIQKVHRPSKENAHLNENGYVRLRWSEAINTNIIPYYSCSFQMSAALPYHPFFFSTNVVANDGVARCTINFRQNHIFGFKINNRSTVL